MKISKRRLKRIIKEEYIKLKRQGLITESSNIPHGHKGIGEDYFDDEVGATEETMRHREAERERIGTQRLKVYDAAHDGYSAGKRGLPKKVPPHFRQFARNWKMMYDQGKNERLKKESSNYRSKQKRILSEGGVKNLLIEIEEVLFAALGSKPSGKMDMEYAIDLIMLNFPEVFTYTSRMKIEEFISGYNDVYHDIYIDSRSRTITYKR